MFRSWSLLVAVLCACSNGTSTGTEGHRPEALSQSEERPPESDPGGDERDAGAHDASSPTAAVLRDASMDAVPPEPPLVDVSKLIPDAVLDIRYATANNFVGEVLYPKAVCLLREPVARKLQRAARYLRKRGYLLRLWDCYRPFHVQETLFRKVSDPRYVGEPERDADGKPSKGSRHNRGAAVDLSLVRADGRSVTMPTGYDDFSVMAHRKRLRMNPSPEAQNALLLEAAMRKAGFIGLPTEWWHFDARNWKDFALLDVPL